MTRGELGEGGNSPLPPIPRNKPVQLPQSTPSGSHDVEDHSHAPTVHRLVVTRSTSSLKYLRSEIGGCATQRLHERVLSDKSWKAKVSHFQKSLFRFTGKEHVLWLQGRIINPVYTRSIRRTSLLSISVPFEHYHTADFIQGQSLNAGSH